MLAVPLVLVARLAAVSGPVLFLGLFRKFERGTIPVLTWGGLAQVVKHLEQVDRTIMDLLANNELLIARYEILTSIPGISKVTAFSILIEMSELETMSGKQAACLAGLAPISRQSGQWQDKERIRGGRTFFRRAMYMPALCTIRHDLSSKKKYDQLVKAGKPPKVALTAIMRKLVVVANALLRDGRS